ncbi:MAG: HD domain-containing protein [Oscillospiraceae bacterium]
MNINIPNSVSSIISSLEKNGFEAYIVGGCVRDSLLGLEPNDWDICTNAKPEQVKLCFSDNVKIIETGIKHGTVTVIIEHQPYEVTTYRVDGDYSDNRHPNEVKFVSNIKEDLSRRDFTINAMAYSSSTGLIDYFNGRNDLDKKLISCVGNSDKRFVEDALRIMRALRFASTYGFVIANSTQISLKQNKELLTNISAERINIELCKLLCGKGAEYILSNYAEILCVFIPEIKDIINFQQHNPYHNLDVWQHTIKSIVSIPQEVVLRLTMLFHDIGKPLSYKSDEQGIGHFYCHAQYSSDIATKILKRLKFDNDTILQVNKLILYHDADIQPQNSHIKHWLNKIGEQSLRQLIQVKQADIMAQNIEYRDSRLAKLKEVTNCIDYVIEQQQCFSLNDLAVNGNDLIDAGVPQGLQIGIILNKLMDKVIDEQVVNEKSELLKLISNIF